MVAGSGHSGRVGPGRARARDLLWAATGLVVIDVVVGGGWDGQYHQTQPFDGFFSPPHLLIYALAAVGLGIVSRGSTAACPPLP